MALTSRIESDLTLADLNGRAAEEEKRSLSLDLPVLCTFPLCGKEISNQVFLSIDF